MTEKRTVFLATEPAKSRNKHYLSTEGAEPPKHHGVVGELVSRFGVNARVWVHPLAITRGTTGAKR